MVHAVQASALLANVEQALKLAIPGSWRWTLRPEQGETRTPNPKWPHLALATIVRPDARLDLRSPTGERYAVLVEAKESLSPSRIVQFSPLYKQGTWLLAAPIVGPRTREVLNAEGISWLEFAGDCRIQVGGLFVERTARQRKSRTVNTAEGQRRFVANLFSGAALRMVRWLLVEPEHSWTVTEMGRKAKASAGFVSRAFATLERDAYIIRTDGAAGIRDFDGLLGAWAKAPPLHDIRIERVSAAGPAEVVASIAAAKLKSEYALTTEAAAEFVAPFARFSKVEMYVADANVWSRLLRLEAVSRGGNVALIRPQDPGVFDGGEIRQKVRLVSWPQLFVDLYRKGGAAREAAEFLRSRRQQPPRRT